MKPHLEGATRQWSLYRESDNAREVCADVWLRNGAYIEKLYLDSRTETYFLCADSDERSVYIDAAEIIAIRVYQE